MDRGRVVGVHVCGRGKSISGLTRASENGYVRGYALRYTRRGLALLYDTYTVFKQSMLNHISQSTTEPLRTRETRWRGASASLWHSYYTGAIRTRKTGAYSTLNDDEGSHKHALSNRK